MRKAFIDTLIQLAEQDKDIWLLTADMGFGLVEQFATRFPKRYINVGVAEQNMIGVATGLALEGKKVFCYSIANFPTLRCLEQIRNDVCYHNLPVCIVSGGAGLWYGNLGMTHHAVEDIAVMRCLPNMTVVSPGDATEMRWVVGAIATRKRPCYLRMSRTGNYNSPFPPSAFGQPTPTYAYTGSRIVLLATGGKMSDNAIQAAEQLKREGIKACVWNIIVVKPTPYDFIRLGSVDTDAFVTIEEHSKIGGLGSAVAEVLAGMKHHPPLVRMGTDDCYPTTAVRYEELLKYHHLTTEDIVKEVINATNTMRT